MSLEQQVNKLIESLWMIVDRLQRLQSALWSVGWKVGKWLILIWLWVFVMFMLLGGDPAYGDHRKDCVGFTDADQLLDCYDQADAWMDNFVANNPDLFSAETIIKMFSDNARTWVNPIVQIATVIFWSLAVIEFVLSFGMMAIRGTDLNEFTVEFLKRILILSFGAFLLSNPNIFYEVINGFRDTASITLYGTVQSEFILERVLQIPFDVADRALRAAEGLNPVSDIVQMAMIFATAVIILWAMASASIQLVVVLCEMYIVITVGLLALGFFSFHPTREYPMRFFGGVIAVGFKLMALELIISIGFVMAESWSKLPIMHEAGPYMLMAISALLYKEIALKVPNYIQSLLTASPGSGVSAEGIAAGAMAVAGAAVAAKVAGVKYGGVAGQGVKSVTDVVRATGRGKGVDLPKPPSSGSAGKGAKWGK